MDLGQLVSGISSVDASGSDTTKEILRCNNVLKIKSQEWLRITITGDV